MYISTRADEAASCKQWGGVNKSQICSLIQQRWNIYDSIDSLRFGNYDFNCPICDQDMNTCEAERYETNCVFLGGKLTRFKCSNCGAIIGPLKMFALSQREFDLDYRQHYIIYPGGDATEPEKMTFFQLQPEKNKIYLNYGSGAWSKTIQELRDEGWDVYGYEPYADVSDIPHIITSKDMLATMRFDGIFTNDVLEHLRDPIEALVFMKSILKDSGSMMVHATPCYEYSYEYTRFHVLFFTGNSIHSLCRKAGLEAYDRLDTVIGEHTYSSYKMKIAYYPEQTGTSSFTKPISIE